VLQDYVDAVADAEARVERLTGQIADLLPNWSLAPVVAAVQAMRGVAFIVAVTVVAEVGDVQRFADPRQLMAYLGLTPSEHSTGSSVSRGGITKAGSGLARRVLIEGAWSYRMQAPRQPEASRPDRGAAEGRARHRLERAVADVPALPPSGRGRQGQGRRHHGHRPRRWSASSGPSPAP
jgi:transposase